MALQRVALSLLNVGMAGLVGATAVRAGLRRSAPGLAGRCGGLLGHCFKAGAALAATGMLLVLWAEAAAMADVAWFDAWPALPQVLRESRYGHVWLVGAGALALFFGLGLAAGRVRQVGPIEGLALAALTVFALTRSLVSHAAGAAGLAPLFVDAVHLLAVSLWAGEVFVSASVTLSPAACDETAARRDLANHVAGLSATAACALGVVLFTGALAAWRGLHGSPAALLLPAYGQVLLLKLGLVALAVALGAYNRWAVMPGLLVALRAPSAAGKPQLQRFRRVLRLEALVLLAVLVSAAVLSTSEPSSGP